MPKRQRPSPSTLTAPAFVPPYAPSWIDWFIAWLDRREMPAWLILLISAAVVFLVLTLVQWPGTFRPLHALAAAYVPFIFWLIRYLDRSAEKAIHEFRPALLNDVDVPFLQYQLTTLPHTATILVGGGWRRRSSSRSSYGSSSLGCRGCWDDTTEDNPH